MRKELNGLGKIVGLGLGVAGVARDSSADMIMKTVPEQDVVVADGETEYLINVVGDTTGEPTKEVRYSTWQVYFPAEVSFTGRAELPDTKNNPSEEEEDFFYDYLMNSDHNSVNNVAVSSGISAWPEVIKYNERLVYSPGGPFNIEEKALGKYWFTVNEGASGEGFIFATGASKFTVVDGTQYVYGSGLQVENQPFTIVVPHSADFTGPNEKRDGRVNSYDIDAFAENARGPAIPLEAGKEKYDLDDDGDADQADFGLLQRCLSGEELADPSCLPLSANYSTSETREYETATRNENSVSFIEGRVA